MNKTKKSLVLTGSILALILSIVLIFSGIMCLYVANNFITEQSTTEALKQDSDFTYYQLDGENYYFEYEEDGEMVKITKSDIEVTVNFLKETFKTVAVVMLVFAVVYFVLSLLTIIQSAKGKTGNGKIIAVLIMSALIMNFATTVLLAVALSFKDKKPTLENINDYVIEN